MRKKIAISICLFFVVAAAAESGSGAVAAPIVAAWSDVDWEEVDEEIEETIRRVPRGRMAPGDARGNIDVSTGIEMEVPAMTLARLAGKNVTLAFQTGLGIAVSASGKDLRNVERDLNITITDDVYEIPEDICRKVTNGTLANRKFAMREKTDYAIPLNIHFLVGKKYAGKYANLYYYDEHREELVPAGTFVVTEAGRAMFPLKRGDEYVLTVTRDLPRGAKITHTVKSGENLSSIAVRYGVSVRNLMKTNPEIMDADRIFSGENIMVVKQ